MCVIPIFLSLAGLAFYCWNCKSRIINKKINHKTGVPQVDVKIPEKKKVEVKNDKDIAKVAVKISEEIRKEPEKVVNENDTKINDKTSNLDNRINLTVPEEKLYHS